MLITFFSIAHLTNYVGLADMSTQKAALISFIQSLASKPDVWFVTNEQLLQWVRLINIFIKNEKKF